MTWRNYAYRSKNPRERFSRRCPNLEDFDWVELCKWVSKRYKSQYKNYTYFEHKIIMKFGIEGDINSEQWIKFFEVIEEIGLIRKLDYNTIIVADFSSLRL